MTPREQEIARHLERIEALRTIQALSDERTPAAEQRPDIEAMVAYHESQIRQIRMLDDMLNWAEKEVVAMSTTIKPGDIVHWGQSDKPYRVWEIDGQVARIADLDGNRNYGVALSVLTKAEEQS